MSSKLILLIVSGRMTSSPDALPSRICFLAALSSSMVYSLSIMLTFLNRRGSSGGEEVSGMPRRFLKRLNQAIFLSSGDLPLSLPSAGAFLFVILLTVLHAFAVMLAKKSCSILAIC